MVPGDDVKLLGDMAMNVKLQQSLHHSNKLCRLSIVCDTVTLDLHTSAGEAKCCEMVRNLTGNV